MRLNIGEIKTEKMFEKLLSLLPYNPGLAHQMAFYSRRMREEASIRRTGLVFIVLAFFIQFFAVISPPQPTVASSNNDLVNGGFSSAADAASNCRNDVGGYKTILNNYGIDCAAVAGAPTITLASTDHNRQLYSMGRLPYGLAGETPVNIGSKTYYFRYLWAWDKHGVSHYQALKVTSSTGKTYFLLYTCGNLVSIGLPTPVAKPPRFNLSKSMLPGYPAADSIVAPGTTLGYRMVIDNNGDDGHGVHLYDALPSGVTFQSMSLNAGADTHTFHGSSRTAEWVWGTIPNETGNYVTHVIVTVNGGDADGTRICNVAQLQSGETGPQNSNQVCVTVKKNAPPAPAPPAPATPTSPTTPSTPSTPSLPCAQSLSSQDTTACVSVHKSAANLTQHIDNADDTTAQAGDAIVYTLYADNTGTSKVSQFVFQESLSDVLDYADVVDARGGTLDANGTISWPAQDIAAGATVSHQITVRVKNPIPATPPSASDPGHFDMVMTNVYGNTVNINLPNAPVQAVESTAASLPNTGPGTSLVIAALVVMLAGYFYARSNLIAKESRLALKEMSQV